MDADARALILRSTHISRCASASRGSSVCTCLPVARIALIKHALAGLTLDADLRETLLEEIRKIHSDIRQ